MVPICFDVMKPSPTCLVRYFSTVCNMKRIDLDLCQHFTKNEASKLDKKVALYTWNINLTLETPWQTEHWPNYTSEKLSLNKSQIMLHSQISYNFCCKSKRWQNGWTTNFKLTLRVSHHLGFGTTSPLHNSIFIWLQLSNKQLADRKDRITMNISFVDSRVSLIIKHD